MAVSSLVARLEYIPDMLLVIDPHFEHARDGATGALVADATGLPNVLSQACLEEQARLLVQQQVVVAAVRPGDVRVGSVHGSHAITRSGTGFTLSRAVYQGMRKKNRK